MINTPESPPYIPAAHLTSGPLLTTSQLVTQFEDFRNSLRYVSAAPELVFERLVANLSETFNDALELERQHHASDLRMCQSSNKELEKELEGLKHANQEEIEGLRGRPCLCSRPNISDPTKLPETTTSSPAVVATRTRPNPHIGSFHTNEIRYWFKVRAKTSKLISFGRPYTAPPGLPVGLTTLDIGEFANARVNAYTSNARNSGFEIHIDSWSDTVLFGAACSWLEIEADDPDFQFGTYNTLDDYPADRCRAENSREITFRRAYDAPPVVVVWLAGFDMNRDRNWRIKTFETDVTATGFTIHIDTWGDSVLYSGKSTWVAYTVGKPGVCSGRFSTAQKGSGGGYEVFGRKCFSTPPRTMLAINSLDMERGRALRLFVKSSDVSAEGMRWELDTWMLAVVNAAGASYIALS